METDLPESPELLRALINIHEMALYSSEAEIIQEGIELASELTQSEIAYFHIVNEDQETIELITWSKNTFNYCEAVYDRHYPINQAGIWADCARLKKPLIHNDYQNLENKKGYPKGHAHLERHMGAPVIKDEKIKALAGVGNRKSNYTQKDLATLQTILNKVWDLVEYRRKVEAMKVHEGHLFAIKKMALISSWEYDIDEDAFKADDIFYTIFETQNCPDRLNGLLEVIDRESHQKIQNLFMPPEKGFNFASKVTGLRPTGSFKLLIKGEAKPRSNGKGFVFNGIMQDISGDDKQKELEEKAFRDPLTGLGNRNHLSSSLAKYKTRANRIPEDTFAIHFIDLDNFKPVNDRFGHLAGDKVLIEVSKRIERSIRKDDIAVRIGGDEFIVLQSGVINEEQAKKLAQKLINAISMPLKIENTDLVITASIGITMSKNLKFETDTILHEADRALYESKQTGKGKYTVFRGA